MTGTACCARRFGSDDGPLGDCSLASRWWRPDAETAPGSRFRKASIIWWWACSRRAVFVGRGVQAAEGKSDVAFGGVPQGFQSPDVPFGGCGTEQLKVEVVVRLIDFVYAKSLVGESLHDVIEAFEVFVLEEQTGSGGDFGFDLAA